MNEKNFFDILNHADDNTIEELASAVEFTTPAQREKIFNRSINKAESHKTSTEIYNGGITVSGTEKYKPHIISRIAGIAAALIIISGGAFTIYRVINNSPEIIESSVSSDTNTDYKREDIIAACQEKGMYVEAPEMIPAGFVADMIDVKPFIVQFTYSYDERFMSFAYFKNPVSPDGYKDLISQGDSEISEHDTIVNGHQAKWFEQTVNDNYEVSVIYESNGIMTIFGFENMEAEQINSIISTIK
ncbi:MAG: hypothetical protein K6G82_09265 [Ruminococcus sp.]|nr:hypothetical protein [Ruminococcus sp.]